MTPIQQQKERPKRLADCRIDWKHYPVTDEYGNVTLSDCSHLRNDWIEDDCECDANNLADTVKCDKYFAFDYDYEKLRLYYEIPSFEGTPFDIWGLQKMFNDNWLLTPAFVKWMGKNSFGYIVYEPYLESFLNGIYDSHMRVEILKFIVKRVNYIIPDTKKEELPRLKNLLDRYEAAYKLEKKKNQANKKQSRARRGNTYIDCTFNNKTENNYYGAPQQPSSPSSSSSSAATKKSQSHAQRGPKTQFLFADLRGNEDTQRTQKEIERVKKYVADHKMGQRQLDSKATSKLNLMVACFWYRWNELKWVSDEPQGAAIYRFFTSQCGLECGVLPKAFSTKIVEIINSGKKDPDIYDSLYSYFPELNKNNRN